MIGRILGLKATTILCALIFGVGGVVVGARSTEFATHSLVVASATTGDNGPASSQVTPALVRRRPPVGTRPTVQETPDTNTVPAVVDNSVATPSPRPRLPTATSQQTGSTTPQQTGVPVAVVPSASPTPPATGAPVPNLGGDVKRGLHSIRGMVLRVGANQLFLRRPDGRGEGRVVVTAQTIFRERGQQIGLADIHPGDRVIVIGVPRPDGALEAAAIAVLVPS